MFNTAKNYINKVLSENAITNDIGLDAMGSTTASSKEVEAIKLLTRAIQVAYATNPGRTMSFLKSIANSNPEIADIVSQLNSNRSAMNTAFVRDRETVNVNSMDSGGETSTDIA